MHIFVAIMSMLAIWRVTHMLQDEEGPFGIFYRLQAWIGQKPDKVGGINHGFFCFWCLSVWIAIPFAFVLAISVVQFLVYVLALSAGAIFIEQLSLKLEQ